MHVAALASHWRALLEAMMSPGSPPSELPGLFRASKRATKGNPNSAATSFVALSEDLKSPGSPERGLPRLFRAFKRAPKCNPHPPCNSVLVAASNVSTSAECVDEFGISQKYLSPVAVGLLGSSALGLISSWAVGL